MESLKLPEPSSCYKARIEYWRSQGYRRFDDVPAVPGMLYADKEHYRKAWKMYMDAKKALKAWDFADVLDQWEDNLKNGQLPLQSNVVIVDEAQDNNVTQMNIVKLLASTDGRICLVGDMRQSIYSFRGAFPDLFTTADVVLNAETREIGTNYRSEAPIVALSNFIAAGKKWSLGAPAKPSRCTANAPYSIEVLPASFGPDEEAEAVANRIAEDVAAGESAGNYAILCRTNAGRALFEAALTRKGVPVTVIGGSSVFKTREAEAVLAYCVLAQHDALGSLDRVLNMPKRFLPHSFLASIHRSMPVSADIIDAIDVAAKEVKLKPGSRRGAADLVRDLEKLRTTEWKDVPKVIEKMLKSDPTREAEAADEDRMSLISSACRIAERFSSALDFVAFAQKCSDGTAQVAEGSKASNSVTLATVHVCKGLEFNHVYVSANKSMFPHIKSTNREEEHRLFYVAVTRAINKITFSSNKLEGLTSFLPPVEKFAEFLKTTLQ
jgi:DNA helicase-2/ATP-dependent DNA helicase PcrA